MSKFYIQRKDKQYLETVSESENRKQAVKDLKEYRYSEPGVIYYLSSRPCKNWSE